MPEYRVSWEIDIDAASPREAAERALAIQRDYESNATVFDVYTVHGIKHRVDLDDAGADGGGGCLARVNEG